MDHILVYGDSIKKFGIIQNCSLEDKNTLRLCSVAKYYVEANHPTELLNIVNSKIFKDNKFFILGGGSNVLFKEKYNGLVMRINFKGIHIIKETPQNVILEVSAGENWPSLVEYVVSKGWGGIENLAMVPGTAGAAPVQNIACYGHNLSERLISVKFFEIATNKIVCLSSDECHLGYRDSIFKRELKGKAIILSIRLKLDKKPQLNTSYKSRYESVEDELTKIAKKPYTIRDVFNAVSNIRKKKLPDIKRIGTAGSIFTNPVVSFSKYLRIKRLCPDLHYYPVDQLTYDHINSDGFLNPDFVKIPAAWLIESLGWAGKRIGECGVWPTQPLNIVNYGGASPDDLLRFIELVSNKVAETYGLKLKPEIQIV